MLLLLLAPVLLFIFSYANSAGQRNAQLVSHIRGSEIASFSDSVSQDVPRVLEIAGKRAIVSSINYVDVNGLPLDDAAARIRELMVNNSLYGVHQTAMDGASVTDWTVNLHALGAQRGFNVTVNVTSVQISPKDAFTLNLTAYMQVNISDMVQTVNITRTYFDSKDIPIAGFEDPLYVLNSQGFIKRTFTANQSPAFGLAAFDAFASSGRYAPSSTGPSFLDRLEGKFYTQSKYASQTPALIGLDSLVNITEFEIRGLPVRYNQSTLDYHFFNASTVYGYKITGSSLPLQRLANGTNASYGVYLDLNS
jgi:hypothetical protein